MENEFNLLPTNAMLIRDANWKFVVSFLRVATQQYQLVYLFYIAKKFNKDIALC